MGSRRAKACIHFLKGGHAFACAATRLLRDENGQGTVEYILILSVSVVAAGKISHEVLKVLDTGIKKLGGQLEKDLKTGRAPLGIWKN
jgi:Flp pilus assembly pilin Flp